MLQIIGTQKCRSTQKAVRWCKERRIEFQFINLSEKKLSEKEYESIFRSSSPEEYIDIESAYYKKNGYSYREYNPKEEVIEHPELLKTPILRNKGKAHCGFDEDFIMEAQK